jgi:mRNA interferase HicA
LGANGGHRGGTLWLGDRRTILKDPRKEIGRGLLRSMLADLGVGPDELG